MKLRMFILLLSINEYIIEFEHSNNKMIQHQMKLLKRVLTFKLLDDNK